MEDQEEEILHGIMRQPRVFAGVDIRRIANQTPFTFETPLSTEDFEEFEQNDVYVPSSEDIVERRQEFVNKTFSEVRGQMLIVDPDGLIWKKVINEGEGATVPAEATVAAQYKLFKEQCPEAFDSTWLRPKSMFSLSDEGGLLPGITLALRSMRVGEVACFLISPVLMFKDFGHPPRVGPGETILAEIELLNTMAPSSYVESDSYFSSDVFNDVYKLKGNARKAFASGDLTHCIRLYKNALLALSKMETIDDGARAEKKSQMITFGTNLAVVYNKANQHEKALVESKVVLESEPDNKKALLHCGRAFRGLGKLDEASECLRKGLALEPNSRDFEDELRKVELAKESQRQTQTSPVKPPS